MKSQRKPWNCLEIISNGEQVPRSWNKSMFGAQEEQELSGRGRVRPDVKELTGHAMLLGFYSKINGS